MTLFILLIPVTMLLFGYYFEKKAPNEINGVFGYRTARIASLLNPIMVRNLSCSSGD